LIVVPKEPHPIQSELTADLFRLGDDRIAILHPLLDVAEESFVKSGFDSLFVKTALGTVSSRINGEETNSRAGSLKIKRALKKCFPLPVAAEISTLESTKVSIIVSTEFAIDFIE
jgi:hypothetical protein